MNRFVLTEPAKRDLDQIKSFLLEKAGPTITRRVLKDIRAALKLLGKEPGAGHIREDLTGRPLRGVRVDLRDNDIRADAGREARPRVLGRRRHGGSHDRQCGFNLGEGEQD